MAISKKGLRAIVVEDETFYWKVRRKVSHNEGHNVEYAIPIQHESEGRLLFVYVGFCRSEDYGRESIASISPKLIRRKILEGIALGWDFRANGAAVYLIGDVLKNKCQ